jgi:hypothetical protein
VIASETAPQLAFKEVQVKFDAALEVGATGAEVLTVIVFEFKLVLQPLSALTR